MAKLRITELIKNPLKNKLLAKYPKKNRGVEKYIVFFDNSPYNN